MVYLEIIIFLFLLILIYQDFKFRAISWIILPVISVLAALNGFHAGHSSYFLTNTLINLSIILIEFLLITLYFSLKAHSFVIIINKQIGLGDVLFYIPLGMMFTPVNFIVFNICSTLLTLIGFLVFKGFFNSEKSKIPLVGALSIALGLCIVFKLFSDTDIFYDDFLIYRILS